MNGIEGKKTLVGFFYFSFNYCPTHYKANKLFYNVNIFNDVSMICVTIVIQICEISLIEGLGSLVYFAVQCL